MPSSFPCKHSVAAQFAIKITLVLIEEAEPIIMRGRQWWGLAERTGLMNEESNVVAKSSTMHTTVY